MSFAAMSVFEVANSELGEHRYDVHFLSENGGLVRTSAGLVVETEPFDASLFDTLIVGGSTEQSFRPSEGMLAFLRKVSEISRRVAATCVGTFTLAEAGHHCASVRLPVCPGESMGAGRSANRCDGMAFGTLPAVAATRMQKVRGLRVNLNRSVPLEGSSELIGEFRRRIPSRGHHVPPS